MTTRAEHLQWCKDRALAYVDQLDYRQAMISLFSDLSKHPETEEHVGIQLGFGMMINGHLDSASSVCHFIKGCH